MQKHEGMKKQREEPHDQWAWEAGNAGRGGWRVREGWIPNGLEDQGKHLGFTMTLSGATREKARK